jgi:ribosome-associated translation inhibitor RaiA
LLVLACIATLGLAPGSALAEDTETEETAEVVEEPTPATEEAVDDADDADDAAGDGVVTEAELAEAQAAIDEAQAKLDEARRTMEMRIPYDKVEPPEPGPGLVAVDGRAKKLQVSLNKDGSLYLRFAMWLQVWTRAIQQNPGTTVLGKDNAWYGDVGLRRARFLMFGKIAPRTFMLMHIGINNQTFRRDSGSGFKQRVFFHDAWVEFEASKKGHISLGGGLLYWNGISRLTNASTITFMSLDAPISNWPTIEATDQFARQLGLYAKGKAGLFDYRVAVVRPFARTAYDPAAPPTAATTGNYNPTANTWGFSGYFQFQFLDIESNVLPYTVGTYIGAKKVFNWGFGGHAQPIGVWYDADPDPNVSDIRKRALFIASTDLFLDIPFKTEHGGAATWYGAYYYMDFGPNNLRNVGIMNPADAGSGTSANGGGNAYTLLGTGHTGYSELGFLMPGKVGKVGAQFQLYVNTQLSKWEAYNDTMAHVGVGLNAFIHRHNAKVTLEYRNRPIFDASGSVANRKGNSFVLQMHLFI